ncbi:MAG: hypothetical protein Q8N99_08115 [Nanoarchaeota archaeon]|nr:hypothetical protein [Nanoarchaeota archaeon]
MIKSQTKIPAILVTDLYYHFCYHPSDGLLGGFDDYVDTALFLANQNFNQKGIILDNHLSPEQPQDGGRIVERLTDFTHRRVHYCVGLNHKLISLDDIAEGKETEGADLIEREIKIAEEKNDRLALITVGGFTDIAIALNKVKPQRQLPVDVYFATAYYQKDAAGYNVALDVKGFLSVVRNENVNIIWTPGDITKMFYEAHNQLGNSSSPLAKYLLDKLSMYRYCKYLNEGEKPDKIDWANVLKKGCYLWSTPAFLIASNQLYPAGKEPFSLEEIPVEFDDRGKFVPKEKQKSPRIAKVVTSINKEKLSEILTQTIK